MSTEFYRRHRTLGVIYYERQPDPKLEFDPDAATDEPWRIPPKMPALPPRPQPRPVAAAPAPTTMPGPVKEKRFWED